jgi:CRISPR/Cas system CMR-associated protein Cmr3 (group 5 of RAMP superfamily)
MIYEEDNILIYRYLYMNGDYIPDPHNSTANNGVEPIHKIGMINLPPLHCEAYISAPHAVQH